MLLLKANPELKKVFSSLIKTMKVPVTWTDTFVVMNNSLILSGDVRSLIFNFDTKKTSTNLIEIPAESARLETMPGDALLNNTINMVLYAFGKWGVITGLKVDKDYAELNSLFTSVLRPLSIEPGLSTDNLRFFKDGVQITYEDTMLAILRLLKSEGKLKEGQSFATSDSKKDGETASSGSAKKSGESSANDGSLPDDDDDYQIGLWHNLRWKSETCQFTKTSQTQEEADKSRIGNDFYITNYQCPDCGHKLYLGVYPTNRELLIDTDEGRVFMARTYACHECNAFYTPRPGRLLQEGDVYSLKFDDDRIAYEDYLDILGSKAKRTNNYKFNEYESERNRKKDAADSELSGDAPNASDTMAKSSSSAGVKGLTSHLFKGGSKFLSRNKKKPESAAPKETADVSSYEPLEPLDLEAEPLPDKSFSAALKLDLQQQWEAAAKTDGGQQQRTIAAKPDDRQQQTETAAKPGGGQQQSAATAKPVSGQQQTAAAAKPGGGQQQTAAAAKPVSGQQRTAAKPDGGQQPVTATTKKAASPAAETPSKTEQPPAVSAQERIRLAQKTTDELKSILAISDFSNHVYREAVKDALRTKLTAKYDARMGALNKLSQKQLFDLKKQIAKETVLAKEQKAGYEEKINSVLYKAEEGSLGQKVERSKNKTYAEIEQLISDVENQDIPDELKIQTLQKLHRLKADRAVREVEHLLTHMPLHLDRKQLAAYLDKLNQYQEVDLTPYRRQLEERKDMAEKEEISAMLKRGGKKDRKSLWDLYEQLQQKDYSEKNKAPYLDKLYEKIRRMDEDAIEGICPSIVTLSFQDGLKAYEQISRGVFLPELKTNTLEMITRRLTKLKSDESVQLMRKLKRDIEEKLPEYNNFYFYDAREELKKTQDVSRHGISETEAANETENGQSGENNHAAMMRAINGYASGRNPYEYPIMVYDTSRAGNGKEGFVLTPDHIFYHAFLTSDVIDILNIDKVQTSKKLFGKGIFIRDYGGQKIKLPNTLNTKHWKVFSEIMTDFITYLQEKPESRSLEYMASEKHDVIRCYRCGFVYKGGNVCPKCGSKMNH